jgi:hypothetical protein
MKMSDQSAAMDLESLDQDLAKNAELDRQTAILTTIAPETETEREITVLEERRAELLRRIALAEQDDLGRDRVDKLIQEIEALEAELASAVE